MPQRLYSKHIKHPSHWAQGPYRYKSPPCDLGQFPEENFHSNLGLDEFARLCGRSLSAFKRDFEELYNTTPGRWLLNRRLQHARLLIGSSSLSVSEIAFECGFENNSHFSRAFKEHFGAAPVNFRQDKVKTLEQRN